MRIKRVSWGAALSVSAAFVLLMVGCAGIPSAGPVSVGLQDLRQAEQTVQFSPSGPVSGANREEIVRGFVLAAMSSADDYAVARQYLSVPYRGQWDPYSGVVIDAGSRAFRDTSTVAELAVSPVARVDGHGSLHAVASGAPTSLRFEFTEEDGEWRIASAPNGILLDRSSFEVLWAESELFFVGLGGMLVPESRWFLARPARVTEVVNELLLGPSEALARTLRSGFPEGTSLVSGAVTVLNGKATLDLTGVFTAGGEERAEEAYEQLAATLATVSGVERCEILVDGVQLRDISVKHTKKRLQSAPLPLVPAAIQQGEFGAVSGNTVEAFPGASDAIVALDPVAVTLSPDGSTSVALGEDGAVRVSETDTTLIDERTQQFEPDIDPFGVIWTGIYSDPSSVRVTDGAGNTSELSVPWLVNKRLRELRISPDGSRLAALLWSADGEHSEVYVAPIERDADGVPTVVGEEAALQQWTPGVPVDLDWVDQLRFVTLTGAAENVKVAIGGVGIFSIDQGSVAHATHVSGGNRSQLRVLDADGVLYEPQGSGWQRSASGIQVLAKRG